MRSSISRGVILALLAGAIVGSAGLALAQQEDYPAAPPDRSTGSMSAPAPRGVHPQPRAQDFSGSNRPDVGGNRGKEVDEIYRQLLGRDPSRPTTSGTSDAPPSPRR